jgi:hypothetical protein
LATQPLVRMSWSAQGATAVGEQAAQNLKTVVDANTERLRIAAAVATGGASGLAGAGGGPGSRPAKNVTEEGARLNFARDLDATSPSGAALPQLVRAEGRERTASVSARHRAGCGRVPSGSIEQRDRMGPLATRWSAWHPCRRGAGPAPRRAVGRTDRVCFRSLAPSLTNRLADRGCAGWGSTCAGGQPFSPPEAVSWR